VISLALDVFENACEGDRAARFTACHELGHFVLGHSITYDGPQKPPFRDLKRLSEWQADMFAGALLMSRRHVNQFASVEEAAETCGMSSEAAQMMLRYYRMERGLMSEQSAGQIMIEAQKLPWHTPTVTELVIEKEWRSVVGWEGYYEVSNYGEVKSIARTCQTGRKYGLRQVKEHILEGWLGRGGYRLVDLFGNGKRATFRVHTLVLAAFIGPRPPGMECRHLNGNRTDNRLINLAWGTPQENHDDKRLHGTDNRGERSGSVKLTEWDVLFRVPFLLYRGFSRGEIAQRLGVKKPTIGSIISRKNWSWIHNEPIPTVTETEIRRVLRRKTK
jgi:NUMOD4 motif/HNH endonuclease/IrrE N-terminal-like domain